MISPFDEFIDGYPVMHPEVQERMRASWSAAIEWAAKVLDGKIDRMEKEIESWGHYPSIAQAQSDIALLRGIAAAIRTGKGE